MTQTNMALLHELKGVGTAACALLEKLHISTIDELLFHLPRDYEDRSTIIAMNQLSIGRSYLLEGQVISVDFPMGKRKSMAVLLQDETAKVTLRFYHIYQALIDQFTIGKSVRIFGEVRIGARGLELYHPEILPLHGTDNQKQLTAIYPSTDGLSQKKIREYIQQALLQHSQHLTEHLPPQFSTGYALKDALAYIHHPPIEANRWQLIQGQHPAQQRLILEEFIAHQLSLLTRRAYVQQVKSATIQPSHHLVHTFLNQLPFSPTKAQQRVCQEILTDLTQNKPKPMLRLIQGDVGAGKTVVAAISACHALESGWQVALMAPTEILAEQHYLNFKHWLEPLGIQVAWLSGKQKGKARQLAETAIQHGNAQIVIGTHALFQDSVQFKQLGLVIIDEQHRFGVDQRLALRNKGPDQTTPHQLIMTATPIPRTLAMSAYGDLDTSIIDELPPGRSPIQTVTIPLERREQVLERIANNCAEGKQAYWVCTLVEQSETLDAQAAEATFAEIKERFSSLRIGLVHGKMKANEKQQVMQAFKNNQIQLLIATTVIEVGVDIPNATIMVIENAERLGLSQLHQLRGRVGRGAQASFCVLLYKNPLSQHGHERLAILKESNDGFIIAEKDLEIRGPGQLLGTKQTGDMGFKVANLERDQHLLAQAHFIAKQLMVTHPKAVTALLQRWLPNAPRYAYV